MTYTKIALDAVRHLAQSGRGSCTAEQKQAGAWAAEELRQSGAQDVALEPFQGAPSTYRPFVAAFGLAGLGSAAAMIDAIWWGTAVGVGTVVGVGTAVLCPYGWWILVIGALLNLLGAWIMFAETEFLPHPAGWVLPKARAQNVVATLPAKRQPTRSVVLHHNVVLCAHLDSHRTPIFYSSAGWQRAFSLLVTATFLSMALGGVILGAGAIWIAGAGGAGGAGTAMLCPYPWVGWVGWVAVILLPVQLFALGMMASADRSPFSPGANDDASGVGVILGLAKRLQDEPLEDTTVHIALTDCEETGAWGMRAYLDQHAADFGKDAVYIILDEVGLETIKFLRNDGLIRKHATHPQALALLRAAAAALPAIPTTEQPGLAYTDALVATKRGLVALTLCSVSRGANAESAAHWHQMSDTPQFVSEQALENAHQFVWQILQALERAG